MGQARSVAAAVAAAALLLLSSGQQADARSANVAALQAALQSAGLYPAAIDGVRGPLTRRAVKRFQRRRHLAIDGIAGPKTRRALGRWGRPNLGSRLIRRGHRGWDVAALQFLLVRRGYSPGPIDGVFGAGTTTAVTSFQTAARLAVDGIAGPATIDALRRGTRSPTGPVRFYRPVPGPIGDGFGAPRDGGRRRHAGIDFPVAAGTLVQASGVGTTVFAGWNSGGYGNLVVVQHRLGYSTWYAHLSTVTSWVGEQVSGGTRIGYVGATGHATGPHLHFEVRLNNVPIDPLPYLLPGTAVAARTCRALRVPVDYRRARIDDCRN
jgi:peptidoglycan hydrolase-like protein with peptidoglycan-binding domain